MLIFFLAFFSLSPGFAQDNSSGLGEPDQIRREMDEILAQPEFRRLRTKKVEMPSTSVEAPGWLERFFKKLWEWLRGSANAVAGLGRIAQVLAYLALAAIAALIIWLVVRAVNRYLEYRAGKVAATLRPEEGEADIPPGDLPADEYRRKAEELARDSRCREAIGQLILGAMSRIERAGLIRFRRGLTHRDYLRALRPRPAAHGGLRAMVGVYEPICFGRRPAHDEHYRTAIAEYNAQFGQPLDAGPILHLSATQ